MFGYSFTTEGQLMNIARGFNYKRGESKDDNGVLMFYHGGVETIRVRRSDIEARIAEVKSDDREMAQRDFLARRLKAIIIKYREMSLRQTESADEVRRTVCDDKNEGRAKTRKELMRGNFSTPA